MERAHYEVRKLGLRKCNSTNPEIRLTRIKIKGEMALVRQATDMEYF
jgi:hypothetical protein